MHVSKFSTSDIRSELLTNGRQKEFVLRIYLSNDMDFDRGTEPVQILAAQATILKESAATLAGTRIDKYVENVAFLAAPAPSSSNARKVAEIGALEVRAAFVENAGYKTLDVKVSLPNSLEFERGTEPTALLVKEAKTLKEAIATMVNSKIDEYLSLVPLYTVTKPKT